MRMIDADALIESIKGWYCKDCDSYNGVRCRACSTDDAMSAIDSAPTVMGWVSVNERLPEREGLYLCWTVLNGVEAIYQIHLWKDGRWYWIHEVRYWMPLPEPPEMQD